jgi:hypothetical protein
MTNDERKKGSFASNQGEATAEGVTNTDEKQHAKAIAIGVRLIFLLVIALTV